MFEIKLGEKDLEILDRALTQLPYYQVAELIAKINQQISEQVDSED